MTLASDDNNATFIVRAPTGATLTGSAEDVTSFVGTLPATGDYVIAVRSTEGSASYTLDVDVLTPAEARTARIEFGFGAESATRIRTLADGDQFRYVLRESEGQQMDVAVTSDEINAGFTLTDPNGNTLTRPDVATTDFSGTLPATGDYVITVGATGGSATYTLDVDIS